MKKIDYEQLYLDEEVVTIRVNEEDKTYNNQVWDIQLRGIGSPDPDCKVHGWCENFWFRTPKGMNRQKYKSKETMKMAIEKMLKKYGYHVLRWQTRNNDK